MTTNLRQKRLLGWLAVAAWIVTFGSCCVAGVHRGTKNDPDNPAAVAVFYAALVSACILTAIRLRARQMPRTNSYTYKSGLITRRNGLFTTTDIPVSQVLRWWVVPEMVFDIVYIELKDGSVFQWLDRRDDLLAILKDVAQDKELDKADTRH